MSGKVKKKKLVLPQQDDHLDLVPLIDCVFLILLFFMLVGRLSTDERTTQITVPPTKTAVKFQESKAGWTREVINTFGSTQQGAMPGSDSPPRNSIKIGQKVFNAEGINDYRAYVQLRNVLDQIYAKAEKYPDPKGTKMMLPKVIVEIRADADTEYRVIQEIQQVLTDTVVLTNMQPKRGTIDPTTIKPFVNLDFTTRNPSDG